MCYEPVAKFLRIDIKESLIFLFYNGEFFSGGERCVLSAHLHVIEGNV